MSTNYSPLVEFFGDLGRQEGQLIWHNVSSTVSWMVDGVDQHCFQGAELKALQLAATAESLGVGDRRLTGWERETIQSGLWAVGGFKVKR